MNQESEFKKPYVNIEELDWQDYIHYWNGKRFNGTAIELFPNGDLRTKTEFSHGMENGKSKEWYESGQIMNEESYKLGTKHGISKSWFKNGNIKSDTEYELGILTKEKIWNENGEIIKNFELKPTDSNYEILLQNRETEPAREQMIQEKID